MSERRAAYQAGPSEARMGDKAWSLIRGAMTRASAIEAECRAGRMTVEEMEARWDALASETADAVTGAVSDVWLAFERSCEEGGP